MKKKHITRGSHLANHWRCLVVSIIWDSLVPMEWKSFTKHHETMAYVSLNHGLYIIKHLYHISPTLSLNRGSYHTYAYIYIYSIVIYAVYHSYIYINIIPPLVYITYSTIASLWFQPLWTILVSWDDDFQYMEK